MLRWRDILGRLRIGRAIERRDALALIHEFNVAAMQAEEAAQALSQLPGFSAEGARSAHTFAQAAASLVAGLLDAEAELRGDALAPSPRTPADPMAALKHGAGA